MNIRLHPKMIKESCGTVSFKRGEAFFRANKVTFEKYEPDSCEAMVSGTENFRVVIERKDNGGFRAKCSCPTLASFQKDCQHIAAVLLAIYEYQRKGTAPTNGASVTLTGEQDLAEGILSLFNNQPRRSSGHQLHFENRKVIYFIGKGIRSSKRGPDLI